MFAIPAPVIMTGNARIKTQFVQSRFHERLDELARSGFEWPGSAAGEAVIFAARADMTASEGTGLAAPVDASLTGMRSGTTPLVAGQAISVAAWWPAFGWFAAARSAEAMAPGPE